MRRSPSCDDLGKELSRQKEKLRQRALAGRNSKPGVSQGRVSCGEHGRKGGLNDRQIRGLGKDSGVKCSFPQRSA